MLDQIDGIPIVYFATVNWVVTQHFSPITISGEKSSVTTLITAAKETTICLNPAQFDSYWQLFKWFIPVCLFPESLHYMIVFYRFIVSLSTSTSINWGEGNCPRRGFRSSISISHWQLTNGQSQFDNWHLQIQFELIGFQSGQTGEKYSVCTVFK